uniref:Uncharacterized protein n=1 Tax=Opuntia streptacantha TaxID=393608 RepID=A0A7C9EC38_OPUST
MQHHRLQHPLSFPTHARRAEPPYAFTIHCPSHANRATQHPPLHLHRPPLHHRHHPCPPSPHPPNRSISSHPRGHPRARRSSPAGVAAASCHRHHQLQDPDPGKGAKRHEEALECRGGREGARSGEVI